MERRTIDIWVGLFVLAGMVALLILALKVGNASTLFGGDTYRLVAEFDNVGGLKVRAPVRSAGVLVGRVESITFDTQRYVAQVTLAIDKRYRFP
ncbi:MAG: outer membrane lipid asymmetry maintenance protein MlaD, partial [Azospira oryzae]